MGGERSVYGSTAARQPVAFLPLCLAALLLFGPSVLRAEVTIERSLPESPAHRSEADWKPSPLAPGAGEDDEGRGAAEQLQQFTGRLILGGNASAGSVGFALEDWSTDSQIGYSRLFGGSSLLDLNAEAYRKDLIDSFEERYGAGLSWAGEGLQLAFSGSYDRNRSLEFEGRTERTDAGLSLDIATPEEGRLPLELHWDSGWEERTAEGTLATEISDRRREVHKGELAAGLSLRGVELESEGYLDISHDRIEQLSTLGYGGSLDLIVPLGEVFGISISTSPGYSSSEDQAADRLIEEFALENSGGMVLSLEDSLEGEIFAGRVDSWSSHPDVDGGATVHTAYWRGRSSWSLTAPEELTSTAAYRVTGQGGEAKMHDLAAGSEWSREEGFLRKAEISGRMVINEQTEITPELRRELWRSELEFSPAETMSLSASYDGSRREEEGLSWSHNAAGSYRHSPVEEFEYRFGTSYGYSLSAAEEMHRFSGSGELQLRPQISFRRWEVGASERVELEYASAGRDLLSASGFTLGVPLLRQLSLRYALSWEWVELAAVGSADGSAFTHTTGLTLSGRELPFSLSSSYMMGHGYRGWQHHVDAGLEIDLAESFYLIAELNYRYAETVSYEIPFRFSTLLRYEF